VQDGFLAGFFEDRRGNPAPFEVTVIDTDRFDSATTAYEQAIVDGASFVVGPLGKNAVAEIAALTQRPVPVLALNRIEGPVARSGAALVQLSLAPEDEAARIAELAYGRGARRALLLRPAGTWGDEMENALRKRWQSLGGDIAEAAVYTGQDEYSGAVKGGLGIAASEQRRRTVADMLATPVEFTPRRRQDLDAVFMLARSGVEARALKPLLAFHYAGALPVYATSSVYGGREDPRDNDLDGLNLVELPWMLGSDPALKSRLDASASKDYPRLQALGVDAYRLQSHFNQLQGGAEALLRGDTGLLTMNPQLQILRELPAATFDGPELRAAR
jgi:outer membrane PBP1 activator LpoA protein